MLPRGRCPGRAQAPSYTSSVQPLTSRALRSIAFGVVAVGLALVAGFEFSGLQTPLALAVLFVLVFATAMPGPDRVVLWVGLHPLLTLIVVFVVGPTLLLFLVSPTYITPGPRHSTHGPMDGTGWPDR